jgi:hypothetical protein
MVPRTTEQRQEANRLILEHRARATPKGLGTPAWNAILWRYIDLPKLIDMLVNKSIPLIRVDGFEDKWEGFQPRLSDSDYQGFFRAEQKKSDLELLKHAESLRKLYYASCWHLNDMESDAMWKLYRSGNEGLAIRTTYQDLIYSLRKGQQDFLIGEVRYRGPSRAPTMLLRCMTKRQPFAHEKELRIIWHDAGAEADYRASGGRFAVARPFLKRIPCDLEQLIEKVYISPTAGAWFAPVVRDVLRKYRLKQVVVEQSLLAGEPPWDRESDH